MTGMGKSIEHRVSKRMDRALLILLPDQEGEIVNISASGVCFEVITNDIDMFCPGTIIPLKITTIYMTFDSTVMKFCLSGKGLIICREVIEETTDCGIKLNLAVQFVRKLIKEKPIVENLDSWMLSNN